MSWIARLQERMLLARAETAWEEGELEEARRLLEALLDRFPNAPEPTRLLAQIRWTEGSRDEAEALLRRALEHNPQATAVREDLKTLLLERAFEAREQGEVETAVSWLRQALELSPTEARLHYLIGCVYADQPDRYAREAFDAWFEALRLRPDYPELRFDLGQVYFENDRFEEAKEHLQEAFRLRPDWPAPAYLLAVIAVREGDHQTAMEYLLRAVAINAAWGQTAWNDPEFAVLRGTPEFDALGAAIPSSAFIPTEELEGPQR
ncbi:MAG: hypothetical protein KatS3mg115_0886 [Candidatus Poribacteria bacterium]|nr:MAG: hypothetical protein KatS3mg115_0886 [Candidatus Poribacteria bacterium]